MPQQIDQARLVGVWVHSHEEDRADLMVLRRGGYAFPPSRGRLSFRLDAFGAASLREPGPDDQPQVYQGEWSLESDVLRLRVAGRPELRYVVYRVDDQRLEVRQQPAEQADQRSDRELG